MAKFSNCLQIVNNMPEQDQEALLTRLDELQAQGMTAKEAQLQAAIDVLAQVQSEAPIKASTERTDTPEFKRWSRDLPVIEADFAGDYDGGPAVFQAYHGTTHDDITEFKQVGSKEGALGQGPYFSTSISDVNENYAGVGPDLTGRIEREKERVADGTEDSAYSTEILEDYFADSGIDQEVTDDNLGELMGDYGDLAIAHAATKALKGNSEGLVMPVYVRLEKPFNMATNPTYFEMTYPVGEDGEPDYEAEPEGSAIDLINAINEVAGWYSADADRLTGWVYENGTDGISARELFDRAAKDMSELYDDNSELISSGQFVQDVAREMGFDGFIQDADLYFGTQRRGLGGIRAGAMKGVNPGTLHIMPFDGSQVKSITGNSGEFGENRDILKSVKRPEFYSQLQRAIEQVPARLDNMAAPAWKQWLTANASKLGVKADELEWSGIKDYLDLQGKAKLSKDELSSYLDDSGVKVSETVLGDIKDFDAMDDDQLAKEYERIRGYKPESYGEPMSREEILDELEGAMDEDLDDTKYSQYTLPGGKNYRELLITLPEKPVEPKRYTMEEARAQMTDFQNPIEVRENGKFVKNLTEPWQLDDNKAKIDSGQYTLHQYVYKDARPKYKSSHWDEPNILAHIRVNDRTDADGKRVLFVEEVQSDWGQEGKKKGFAALSVREVEGGWAMFDGNEQVGPTTTKQLAEEDLRDSEGGKTPVAPFVTKTEGWVDLALKRIAMMAVEGGYDKVAFVNGEQSVTRYEEYLRQAVDSISYEPTDKGYYINVMSRGQNVKNGDFTASELEDIVGKEIVQKMEARKGKVEGTPGAPDYEDLKDIRTLRGDGLKIGGEGMIKFYGAAKDPFAPVGKDKSGKPLYAIIPQRLSKLLPKLGGGKPGKVDAGNATEVNRVALTAKIRNLPFNSKKRAELTNQLHAMEKGYAPLEQLGFDVTEKMRETVGQGVALFSRKRESVEAAAKADKPWFDDLSELKITKTYQLGDLLKSSGKLSWWHKSVGTMFNIAERHPQFKRAFDAVQRFIGDVSLYTARSADLAPNFIPNMETLADLSKTALSPEDVKALSKPIFHGTLKYTRDEDGNIVASDDVSTSGVVFKDEELREMFGLDDRQISLYREFRRAVNKSLSDMAVSDMIRYLGREDSEGVRQQALDADGLDSATNAILAHIDNLISLQPKRSDILELTKKAIKEKRGETIALMARGYAPLSRFGHYTVHVQDANGETQYFDLYETKREANKAAREMQGWVDEDFPGGKITTGTMSEESYKLFGGVNPETLSLLGEAMGLEENGVDKKSEAYQMMLKLAKTNRSAMKRLIERKGVEGYSMDAPRVLAGFIVSNGRQISTNLHAGEISRSVNEIDKTNGELKDAAVKLMDYINNPREEAQGVKGLLYAVYLGGNISSAAIQFTQTLTTTLPYLSQFDTIAGATSRVTEASKLAARGIRNDDDLKQALKRAEDSGVVKPQDIFHIMGQAQGKGALQVGDGTPAGNAAAKANNLLTKLNLIWGRMFGWADQFNRRIAFIASYKLARDKGMADPYAFATKTVNETQFLSNKGARPAWSRGALGGIAFTFKSFMINYLELLARMATKNGPEGKKAFAFALGMLWLMAGAQGMPGADDMDDIIDGFMQRVLGRSFDSKMKKKEFFASLFGQPVAEFIMGGLTSIPGSPIDIGPRISASNVVPGIGILTKKNDYTNDVMEVFGVGGSLLKTYLSAAAEVPRNGVVPAMAMASPTAIQNFIKAADMWQMGYYRDSKGRKVVDTNEWEAVMKGFGFQPKTVKAIQDATGEQQGLIAQNRLAWQEIRDLAIAGRVENNKDKQAEARERFDEWNKKNPDSPLKWNAQSIQDGVRNANMDKAKRVANSAPKAIQANVKRELQNVD